MDLKGLQKESIINPMDRVFGEMIQRLDVQAGSWVATAAALVSRAVAHGDVCLDLESLVELGIQNPETHEAVPIEISLGQWQQYLAACQAVGAPGDFTPLILKDNRLYLHRYWQYECHLAQAIVERCSQPSALSTRSLLFSDMAKLFPGGSADQQKAVFNALSQSFTVISGGPGTGKTFTIAKLIILLQELTPGDKIRIKLAAPTGKAAARLQEALEAAMAHLGTGRAAAMLKTVSAQTLHRLLGTIPGKTQFRYNAQHPMAADVVIVDEASMIDLALMSKLIQAVPRSANLILVGDRDQLASVEAGSVLGDICGDISHLGKEEKADKNNAMDAASVKINEPALASHIIMLRDSFRFNPHSGIDALAGAVNAGDAGLALSIMEDKSKPDIVLTSMEHRPQLFQALEKKVMESIAPIFEMDDPATALKQLNELKILTPLRNGPYGVKTLNDFVEQILVGRNIIDPPRASSSLWYPGRPVMITRNDYYHNLFNGDIGITMAEGRSAARKLWVVFTDPGGGFKKLTPQQLPEHETVYVMTVHKSQGSEFNKVVLLLPDKDAPVLTRELIYTAITRARVSVEVWADPALLKTTIRRSIRRVSGLRQAMWPQ